MYFTKKKNGIKVLIPALLLLFVFASAEAQANKTDSEKVSTVKKPKLKQYWFVMLIKGANRNQDSTTAQKIQEGHMANINRLAGLGKLLVAGPFGDDGNWRGIFILDCKDEVEAEQY